MKAKGFNKPFKATHFTPPKPTRGGYTDVFKKPVEQPLTGIVHQLKAAQGEERFARTLEKGIKKGMVQGYYFRYSPGMPRNTVGWKELDFLVGAAGQTIAISIVGTAFVHKSSGANQQDLLNDLIILGRLNNMGYNVPEIKHISSDSLDTQEHADKAGRDLGVYR